MERVSSGEDLVNGDVDWTSRHQDRSFRAFKSIMDEANERFYEAAIRSFMQHGELEVEN